MSLLIKRAATALMSGAVLLASFPGATFAATTVTDDFSRPAPATQLVQLTGLTVTSVEGIAHILGGPDPLQPYNGVIAQVTVTAGTPVCALYATESSVRSMPCPMSAMVRQYTINVYERTTVLDRNRRAMNYSDISVGDTVNVYGYLDQTTATINPIILRDTTKPETAMNVQLEQLQVLAVNTDSTGVMRIFATRNTGPCYQYVTAGRLSYPCPEGAVPAPNVRSSLGIGTEGRGYTIIVPTSASVMDVNRRPLARSEVMIGDTINVYGTMKSRGSGEVTAIILRDLSRPGSVGSLIISGVASSTFVKGTEANLSFSVSGSRSTPYSWSISGAPKGMSLVTAGVINCLVAPCPQPDTSVATIAGTPTSEGRYQTMISVRDSSGRTASMPLTISVIGSKGDDPVDSDVLISVDTDKDTYASDETVKITITAENDTRRTKTLTFGGCQASYDLLPGFSLRSIMLCAAVMSEVKLKPGQEKEWTFEHQLNGHQLPAQNFPMKLNVVGYVHAGEGDYSATKTITVNAIR